MKYINSFYCLTFICLTNFSLGVTAQINKVVITNGWEFRQVGTAKWNAATVPGEVHSDLLNNKFPIRITEITKKNCNGLKKRIGNIKLLFQ